MTVTVSRKAQHLQSPNWNQPSRRIIFCVRVISRVISRCDILNPNFWNKDDEIMADKGFTIKDLLDPLGVKLNIPIFLEDKAQFLAQQVVINQQISSLRIHVERYISRIKNFHIFDKPLPLTMHGSANQIFTVCSFLVMFQNPIISV